MATNSTYSDFDINFLIHPVRKTLSKKLDDDAVKQSAKNLILTKYFERPFEPDKGCGIHNFLFEPMTQLTATNMENAIRQVLNNYEPRVDIRRIDVIPNYPQNRYDVTLVFNILNQQQPTELNIILERLR